MGVYEFTLRLERDVTESEAAALYAACADAVIESGSPGAVLMVTRDADSWGRALGSAVGDVERTTGVRVVGAGQEDLVTIREIAIRAGRTREAVRLWAAGKRGPGGFPAPEWESPAGERFWSWAEVARWIRDHLNLAVDVTPEEVRLADEVLRARHAAQEARRSLAEADEETRRQLERLLGAA
jgi:hypothetical protein